MNPDYAKPVPRCERCGWPCVITVIYFNGQRLCDSCGARAIKEWEEAKDNGRR